MTVELASVSLYPSTNVSIAFLVSTFDLSTLTVDLLSVEQLLVDQRRCGDDHDPCGSSGWL